MILVVVATLLAGGCADAGGDEGAAAPAGPATTAASTSGDGDRSEPTSSRGSASGDADTDDVRIEGFAFAPKTVSAKAGQRVKWEHQDPGVTHTVVATGGAFRSGDLEEGDEFSHLFRTAGTFAYRCTVHPDMRGTVKVSG